MHNTKVLVVDDEKKIRTLLQLYFTENEYTVVTAENGTKALEIAKKEKPNIMILDVMMPDMTGFTVCEKLRKYPEYKDIPVIYLSSLQDSESIITGLDSGGDDYVTKPFDPNVLIAKVQAVLRRTNENHKQDKVNQDALLGPLSYQEERILQWIVKGYTNKEIAEKLHLTEGTIKVYNHTLFQKMQVKNRSQAIVKAQELI